MGIWLDGWMDDWVDGWMCWRVIRLMDESVNEWMGVCVEVC